MKTYTFYPNGVCCKQLDITLNGWQIENINISGGCDGNLQGIARLIVGMDARDAMQRMEGIPCGAKDTSCPDQISRALKQLLEQRDAQTAAQ